MSRNGFAVPVVLVFIVVLALLGGTAAMLTTRDLQVAGLYASSQRASAAASSAMDHAVLVFADSGPRASAWPVRGTVDGHAYEVRIARDTFDFGTGAGPVSLDERGPGAGLNTQGRGDSVFVLTASATRGVGRAVQRLWVAERLTPRIPAALTIHAGGVTQLQGGWSISGTDVDIAGVPVAPAAADTSGFCGENRPAVAVRRIAAPAPVMGVAARGNDAYSTAMPPYTSGGSDEGWVSPEDVLGIRDGALDGHRKSGLLHGLARPDSLSGVTWITDTAGRFGSCLTRAGCGHLNGRGILIIHNPRYDPREHDPGDPAYDAARASNPAYAPARLHDITGGEFRGIVIVDELPRLPSGSVRVRGAVVELSRRSGSARLDWPPSSRVEYSCEAIEEAARAAGLGPRRLGWTG